MGKLRNTTLGWLVASQILTGCAKGSPTTTATIDAQHNLIETLATNTTTSTINEIITTRNTIAYFINKETILYKDAEGKQTFIKMHAGVFLRADMINEEASIDDYLCIEINQKKVWITKSALTENTKETFSDFFKSATEKVIMVDKDARIMTVYDQFGKHKVKEFNIALSPRGEGDKKVEGDGNTPEGKYYICAKNPASSFGTNPNTGGKLGSLHISYPNTQDAIEGLIGGDITTAQYNNIKAAIQNKSVPNQGTKLGNYIMIHGGGSNSDWTIGCVALNDEDMLRLYNFINTGADLFIQ